MEIPKANGGKRPLGIPSIADRVAQTVAKMVMEPTMERIFHPDSYGYRPGRSALDAVGTARKRCWKFDWVIDLDIKSFFDSIPWHLIEKAVVHRTELSWIRLYVKRWLQAPVEKEDGILVERTCGTPQGSVVSPLLIRRNLEGSVRSRHKGQPRARWRVRPHRSWIERSRGVVALWR